MDENLAWLTQKTEEPKCNKGNFTFPPNTQWMQFESSNLPVSTSTPLFQGYPLPFLAKFLVPLPSQVTQFLEGPYWRGGATMNIFNNLVKGEHRSNTKTGGAYNYLLQSFGGDIRFILNQSSSSIGPVFTNSLVLINTNLDSWVLLHRKWSFLRIWSHLLKKYLMENFIFCAVYF